MRQTQNGGLGLATLLMVLVGIGLLYLAYG